MISVFVPKLLMRFAIFLLFFFSGRQTVADSGLENQRQTMRTPPCTSLSSPFETIRVHIRRLDLVRTLFSSTSAQEVAKLSDSFVFPPFSVHNPLKVSPHHFSSRLPTSWIFWPDRGDSHGCCCFSCCAPHRRTAPHSFLPERNNNREPIHQF